ncbi:GntR family transcriptional regulator [Breznakia sp. PF5-3]|uniref:GntR family transcriptional regulator n=1 Tax=unclassified Breznakia TaxID=2623764 RepID=UPI0024069F9B|nr:MULTISPECIES: GntR family transcriptional regulator [unclassified Breznakia]MDF9824639.1 GntR family transcriptional regulator [Breznakia sp. PM6-1]MDF9835575.1 GntR family transcriptional regulator [Breznakia sp. PF5-3]MDF9838693.1 GntR family transcriptional regulator [Breznakia sp. PFB2-8]MDF9860724.1 GntR family transcriptional regulator [Breznakia sp. PH5-24]
MSIPIYLQIKEKMIDTIRELPANAPIPSERDLAIQYDASRMTVRKSINALVDEGYLYRDSNKGTFVADKVLHKKNTTLEKKDDNRKISYKTIYFDVKASSSEEVQERLNIGPEDSVVRMIRLMLSDDRPQAIEEIYINRLNLSDEEFRNLPKWQDFNAFISKGGLTQRFVPTLVPMQYAHMLELKIHEPIIMVENIVNQKSGKPLIYMKVFNNPKEKVIEITS